MSSDHHRVIGIALSVVGFTAAAAGNRPPQAQDLTGQWRGGVNAVDFTGSPYCERWGPAALDLRQRGDSITGTMTIEFSNARKLRPDVNLPCQPFPERTDPIRGAVSVTTITFEVLGASVPVQYQGTFTSYLAKGTFMAGFENRGGQRGCWQVARTGAIANCANPFNPHGP